MSTIKGAEALIIAKRIVLFSQFVAYFLMPFQSEKRGLVAYEANAAGWRN